MSPEDDLPNLSPAQRARMAELAPGVAAAARGFPRVTDKTIAPFHPPAPGPEPYGAVARKTDDAP